MAYLKITGIQSFKELDDWLGAKQERTVGYHTVARRVSGDMLAGDEWMHSIAIRQWNTDIYVITPDDIATLDVGSWFTVTTKQRLNDLLPPGLGLWSEKGQWIFYRSTFDPHINGGAWLNARIAPFANGVRVNVATKEIIWPEGYLTTIYDQTKENAAMKKKIAAYIKGLTDEKVAAIYKDTRERGMVGDCLFCCMERTAPAFGETDHLESHIEERYYMASLFLNACAKRGSPEYCISIGSIVRHDLGKFLRKRLLKGVAVA